MPKLIDTENRNAIGKEGLLEFIDDLNERRAEQHIAERYRPLLFNKTLTMVVDKRLYLNGAPSPSYLAQSNHKNSSHPSKQEQSGAA